ncbi:MAG: hypothetical protein R2862_11235 [Thermoanaerobaculia bacterium]
MSRPAGRRPAGRVVLAITATYVAFLLTAQYGFLDQVKAATGGDPLAARPVLLWMVIAGLLASTAAAVTGRRLAAPHAVRAGLFATAIVTGLSPLAGSSSALRITAGALGAALGWLTVSGRSAAELAPRGSRGRSPAGNRDRLPDLESAGALHGVSRWTCRRRCVALRSRRVVRSRGGNAEGESLPRCSGGLARGGRAARAAGAGSRRFGILRGAAGVSELTGSPGELPGFRSGIVRASRRAVAAGSLWTQECSPVSSCFVALLFGLGMPAICASGVSPAVGALGAIAYAAGIAAYSAALWPRRRARRRGKVATARLGGP